MDHMVWQLKRDTSAPLPEVVCMPSLEVGKRAGVVPLSRKLALHCIFNGGVELAL